ncbi:MAG: response regulator [Proteobacteria bacterium]|nr:response regulator [Pseudomonadota bacterium]
MERLRVLVVEDNAIIGMLLADMLIAMGHRVCGVEVTEAGAIEAASRWRPDLMIVDAELEEGDGFEAIRSILIFGPMPHVFMSGTVGGIGSRDSPVLQKPFGEKELVRAIEQAIEMRRSPSGGT